MHFSKSRAIIVKRFDGAAHNRVWRSLVSRLNGVQEAAGSSPVTRTIKILREPFNKGPRSHMEAELSRVERMLHTHEVARSSRAVSTIRPVGQVVKTPPFHGGNMGSSPVRVTIRSLYEHLMHGFTPFVMCSYLFSLLKDSKKEQKLRRLTVDFCSFSITVFVIIERFSSFSNISLQKTKIIVIFYHKGA